ncbi:MAG: hypothetical protein HQM10_02905 [Candidatus Riflebacteria bacterium]|nr:hypothetical protein [Candidatus Riflebacteria bacterium]
MQKRKFNSSRSGACSSYLNKYLLFLLFVFLPAVAIAGAWILSSNRWTDEDERNYSEFVRKFGESKYGNLNKFIRDSSLNPLYSDEDKNMNLYPDCADLPYVIRAYVAYKLKLPFSYTTAISGKGGDQRYSRGNHPSDFKDQDCFQSAKSLLGNVHLVNSGYYRMAPNVENSDTYPVRVDKNSIVPGTIYYDPNGHVAIVYQVTDDGRLRVIDAHPDKSVSRPWFGSKFARGSSSNGGGFRKWRPQIYDTSEGSMLRAKNSILHDFSSTDQYQDSYSLGNINELSYFDYVRLKLSNRGGNIQPLNEFKIMMEDLYEDIKYRALAVNICIAAGINKRAHPGFLPYNIYGTDGLWEEFSTPSRDARLKVAFLEFHNKTLEMIGMAERRDPRLQFSGSAEELALALLNIYNEVSPRLSIYYTNSQNNQIPLTFQDVQERLFRMSFDPFHSVELRWGATGKELESADDNLLKRKMYEKERLLRNQLERLYNQETNFSLGPENPVDIQTKKMLESYIAGRRSLMAAGSNHTKIYENPVSATARAPAPIIIAKAPENVPVKLVENEINNMPNAENTEKQQLPESVKKMVVNTENLESENTTEDITENIVENISTNITAKISAKVPAKNTCKPGDLVKSVSKKSYNALRGILGEVKNLLKQ